ncbi:MAG: nitroreductase family deazaflavin-dependent oxidoreductase [Actinobacteria bacterium]|nr:MAG: nitroreductase family deazaflavin-dependent oxidoreductase [Actinomycetota bacterium]
MSIYKRWILWLGHRRWFAVLGRRFGSRLDRRLYRASDGKLTSLGRRTVPVLLLTTTGRRSRRERTVPVMYIRDGRSFVVSSENFGQKHRAAWPLNLDADPVAKVQVGSEIVSCLARRLTDDEADRHWPRLVQAWPAHATYRRRSGERHTFVLTPN